MNHFWVRSSQQVQDLDAMMGSVVREGMYVCGLLLLMSSDVLDTQLQGDIYS